MGSASTSTRQLVVEARDKLLAEQPPLHFYDAAGVAVIDTHTLNAEVSASNAARYHSRRLTALYMELIGNHAPISIDDLPEVDFSTEDG